LKFEIARILHFKSEIRDRKLNLSEVQVQSHISDFGFEMQESFDFEIPLSSQALSRGGFISKLADGSRVNILDRKPIQFGWQCGADLRILSIKVDLEHGVPGLSDRFASDAILSILLRLAQT